MILALALMGCGSPPPVIPVVVDPTWNPDVNGDGLSDLIAPISLGPNGETEPMLAVILGRTDLGELGEDDVLLPDRFVAEIAGPVALAGDIDGDGTSDLARWEDGTLSLYLGGPNAPQPTPDQTLPAPVFIESAYIEPKGAGDVNGDGYDDLLVIGLTDTFGDRSIALYYGGSSGLTPGPFLNGPDTAIVGATAGLGDLDGDGYDDVVVARELWWGSAEGPVREGVVFEPLRFGNTYHSNSCDADGDGVPDLSTSGGAMYRGGGAPQTEGSEGANDDPVLQPGDFDGDGLCDMPGWRQHLRVDVRSGPGPDYFAREPWLQRGPPTPLQERYDLLRDPLADPDANLPMTRWGWRGGYLGDLDGDGYGDAWYPWNGYQHGGLLFGASKGSRARLVAAKFIDGPSAGTP